MGFYRCADVLQVTIGSSHFCLARMQEIGGASVGDRTMIDALAPALDRLSQGLQAAASAARKGADGSAHVARAKAGRAAYVNSRQLEGNKDPGAEAVAQLFEYLASRAPAA